MTKALDFFFEDIKNTRILSIDNAAALSKSLLSCSCFKEKPLQEKCPSCKRIIDKFVVHNLPLVVKIAQKYQGGNIDLPDLIGFGIYGLFIAASKYDYTKKVRFSSYAPFWIKDQILKALRTCAGVPKIPPYKITRVWKVAQAIVDIEQDGCNVSTEKIVFKTGFSKSDVEDLRQLVYQTISLEDIALVSEQPLPDEIYEEIERTLLIQKELTRVLTDMQLYVICRYHGIIGHCQSPLKDIAISKNLSLEWIRQIKNEAEEILKTNKLLRLLYEEILV